MCSSPNSASVDVGAAALAVPDSAIDAVLRDHLKQEFDVTDSAWLEHEARAIDNRPLNLRRWLRRMISMGRNAREQTDVRSRYETYWIQAPSVEEYVAGLNDHVLAVRWRDRGMLVEPQALRKVHMLYLMKAIQVLQPRRVLEVGCGNGNVVLTLAARFPNIAFTGVELTAGGVEVAREVQAMPQLPASMVKGSPEPLQDLAAHRSVDLKVGDAWALPFADRSFDLVYTRLALEQMEQIRVEALREITRVAADAVVLVEPWRDYNLTDPGRAYVRRVGYFTGKIVDLEKYGFRKILSTGDIPQKVQFSAGPVVALRT